MLHTMHIVNDDGLSRVDATKATYLFPELRNYDYQKSSAFTSSSSYVRSMCSRFLYVTVAKTRGSQFI